MPTRESAPLGAPCWVDLWTSDVEGAQKFYGDLFGWVAGDPAPEFGGYFIFEREGVPVAGGMGAMGDMTANNTWTTYFATPDCAATTEAAAAAGATIGYPPMEVADLGIQSVLDDPAAAHLGLWQAKNFAGITVFDEPGAPSWFELHTRDYNKALEFCQSVLGWKTETVGDTDDFRYSIMLNPVEGGQRELAGLMDSSSFLPEGQSSNWKVYFNTDDVDATIAKLEKNGGSVVFPVQDTPYGRIAAVVDPFGAEFSLRTPPK